jgi:FkbM family methyltransferase
MTVQKIIQHLKSLVQAVLSYVIFNNIFKRINATSIAIDCGANVGDVTLKLARKGASVYAFEPNPYAFTRLVERTKSFKNVTCINKGVWDRNATAQLFFHQNAASDDVFWSFGSSIVKEKNNVNTGRSIEVELIDLIVFIKNLNQKVDFLKIDIEGAEVEILEKFLDQELYKQVAMTVVETHDRKIPQQKARMDRIRQTIKQKQIKNILLTWL